MLFTKQETRFMRRALALARRGKGQVEPNPMVGCVLVKNGRIVAEGWHRRYGQPHAEAEALQRARGLARGGIAYVTLEPCCNHPGKKTPPCALALVKTGISEAVIAIRDANPHVSGKGLRLLRQAGIKVRLGLCAAEAESLNKDFLTHMRKGRPYVILKSALSLDGQAYSPGGRSRWITGPAARQWTHRLRAQADAVLVGIGTVLADNPALTSHDEGQNPVRVVLDAKLKTPPKSRILDGKSPTWIFTAVSGKLGGAKIIKVAQARGRLNLSAVLKELSQRGIGTLLVEGGPAIHASFLKARAVDEAQIYVAPKLISGSPNPNHAPRVDRVQLKKLGEDFMFCGKVLYKKANSR